jgi:hypothetical protein
VVKAIYPFVVVYYNSKLHYKRVLFGWAVVMFRRISKMIMQGGGRIKVLIYYKE